MPNKHSALSSHLGALAQCLRRRESAGTLRKLTFAPSDLCDFTSNDYLGFARSAELQRAVSAELERCPAILTGYSGGSTGSRLLSGNSHYAEALEQRIAAFHGGESALLFNSGYDLNFGFFSSVPQTGDMILYDKLAHNSIREGIKASRAKSASFEHNCLASLEQCLKAAKEEHRTGASISTGSFAELAQASETAPSTKNVFVAVESVYSMDGDVAPLKALVELSQQYGAAVVVDEAHGLGVLGTGGRGLVHDLGLTEDVLATIYTFGKALGCHGAAVVGSPVLKEYLLNYARPLIYSTSLPPHSLACIGSGYVRLESHADGLQEVIRQHVDTFNHAFIEATGSSVKAKEILLPSSTPVQGVLVPGNAAVVSLANFLRDQGFNVLPIRAPTVAEGQERLRICLHAYNTEREVRALATAIAAGLEII